MSEVKTILPTVNLTQHQIFSYMNSAWENPDWHLAIINEKNQKLLNPYHGQSVKTNLFKILWVVVDG